MTDTDRIKRLIEQRETERIEFKTRLINSKLLERHFIGFANSLGGKILFGIADNGTIVGVKTTESDIEKIEKLGISTLGKGMVKTEIVTIDNKNVLVVSVRKSEKTIFSKDNKIYKRVGEQTINLHTITQSNGTKVFTESGSKSYLKRLETPEEIHPGEEKIIPSISIREHDKPLRISFLWGDDSIKVVGAHMVEPNKFEFPPAQKDISWYLKFCASQEIKIECDKQVYINVEEIIENKKIVRFAKIGRNILIGLSFLPLIVNFVQWITQENYAVSMNFWGISVPIPIATVLSLILLNRRITRIINNLSSIKLTSNAKFVEKGIGNSNELVIRSLRVRFRSELKNYNNYAP